MKLPHRIQYTTKVKVGSSKLFNVYINPKYFNDEGLKAHEYEHVKQWYLFTALGIVLISLLATFVSSYFWNTLPITIFTKGLLYTYVRPMRQWMEVKAFKAQAPYYDWDTKDFFAECLVNNYNLKLNLSEAKKLLS